ncbi:DNA-binding response regulator [Mesorhizobium sp. SARCC-RB16n]|uniref:response regulator transcription factor n=1 Tax=Mesorhizobium sp. SARCC-RB16n TaxID=2116687 RepID=UPI00122EBCE2|nr:response regulator transcription factor [Mesorhizobium sp. SARCC-RB16n]KAA3447957.1 DNA-binding response regulator [Mesorhizobium sp. SARCC-RB16n]
MKPLILICSQDVEFYLFFSHVLEVDGFATVLAGGVEDVVQQATECEPQAVVLDCQPATATGPAICARLKGELQTDALPVIALIASGAEHQQLDLLKAGIDETFLRPFAPAKLLAYLKGKLRTRLLPNGGNDEALTCGQLSMEPRSRRVHCSDQQLHLGPLEFNMLRHLMENPGKVCSREELVSAAWPEKIFVGPRTVDVHVSRLRKALSPHNVIRTVRSAGYALEEQEI